jgi:hypothetical protein
MLCIDLSVFAEYDGYSSIKERHIKEDAKEQTSNTCILE